MYEPDSDVYQWGHHLFDPSPIVNTGYYTDTSQHDTNSAYLGQYTVGHYDEEYCSVENDAAIAHTLQEEFSEEFSQLSMREAPEYSHAVEEGSNVPTNQQDWQAPSVGSYWPGNTYDHEQAHNNMWVSDSASSHVDGEAYSFCQRPIDGYGYNDVGNPLDEMIPIPHVPKINGEIPSMDEATSDYERLCERLQLYDLVEHKVQGDGNCQFRALSHQLYKTPENHEYVRREVVNQLGTLRELYGGYVPMDYDDYLCKMSKNGEWGDHVTLQAAADLYAAKIFVITSFKDTCYIEIIPNGQKPTRVLYLSFWAEVHYNSISPREDIPFYTPGKKKKWWSFWG